ncbi:MAG: hypothetical protein OXM57_03825 [bacterium]|nr:hypothetical protein [bacterium]MDE0351799.1 hypothetical protein [bacterium]
MAQLQLRPLGVGEIVDATFTVYRRRFGPMLAIVLVLVFIPFLVSLVGGCSLDSGGTTTCSSPIGWLGYYAGVVGSLVAGVAAILVAAEAYADVPSDWRSAMSAAIRRIVAIIAATIVAGILLAIGFVLLIIPGIFVLVSLAVVWEALIIEGIGPMESIKRSWRLVSGERWRVFGAGVLVIVLMAIVVGVISAVIALILSAGLGVSGGMTGYLVQQVASLLSIPLTAALGTVIYLDLRVRKESLSTDELAAALSEQG